jgi:hypothetical protein
MSTTRDIKNSIVRIVDDKGAFSGTGFFVTNEICVTCHHVISRLNQINVQSKDSIYPAEWDEKHSNMEKNIAVLRVKNSGVTPLPLAKEAFPGADVTIFGFSSDTLLNFPEGIAIYGRLSQVPLTFAWPEQESQGDRPRGPTSNV